LFIEKFELNKLKSSLVISCDSFEKKMVTNEYIVFSYLIFISF